ncbi:hypothetical protein A2833_02235 [Candidatus Azambacteria bacterium RIFCSPHIGHO2_01_FULL_44_55]|uniref:AMP-dependent synthetase/ligase domain-containing protein n=1 Tax=Candidatus Azambacteria bacterium RIFCSPLOWO2_02_FULL_44_14 TaxID=1797306 RepID=A0A1F5CCP3_9BACT|nr:MAG: hypothetical protein A3A18_01605 [Candidatus Azambacteria bacterium RIFCSPLOWO2_01_FULL_44_84]OGD32974.1 MAG: hypothetical protein A3C78_00390 [Candidatus Azambacteria bacterium RIFCSPHIGHO2_02_FULL_45_18]OGD40418.1 MAG: hypothetical protein A2833_02235 [Candidatus Azambacteria bacterium RIFCSPHIGHO2_01_FULL_44_55]OGD40630.1 MAG: hypothetical protein A3I30_01255 [Candidatus Azambacteria bacterium RIFCSPLOWO2_02_FULL_44_14]OGD52319.1 MAG: hypothetical protein A2608_00205 [Candidatus Azam
MFTALKGKILYKIWLAINEMPYWFVAQWQLYRLKVILKIASDFVGMYQDQFGKSGLGKIKPGNLQDLERFPIITKSMIKSYPPESIILKSSDNLFYERANICTVCRSNGEPFRFWIDKNFCRMTGALLGKIGFRDIDLNFERALFVSREAQPLFLSKNLLVLPSADLKSNAADFVKSVVDFNPRFVFFSDRGAMAMFEAAFAEYRLSERLNLKAVFVFWPNLSVEERLKSKAVFGCDVFLSLYHVFHEIPLLGWECEAHNGFHLNRESYILEIVDEKGLNLPPGKEGRIAVTNFDNEIMPFVRYHTGDRGYFLEKPCSCGRRSPIFKVTSKYPKDLLLGGKKFDYNEIETVFRYYYSIVDRFRVEPIDNDTVKIHITPLKNWSEDFNAYLNESLTKLFGDSVKIEFIIDAQTQQYN